MDNVQKEATTESGLAVAVVGSRSVQGGPTAKRLACYLAHLRPALVISGGAAGADQLAASWARANGVPLLELRPDYAAHGAGAPHVRNAEIVRRADLVLVLWDGQSRGTLSAARAAARLGRRCEWLLHAPPAGPAGGLEL
ncbi:SLOG family protein [Hymenobacter weizhouensis]|uniref:SLOG family protein n=1 Tax=Hymenobacter sp. YIM 151500-1 TaxID=2987689 RepID=UPI0022278238|nr:SLOG family protein [Hymenobacter sp. YIM 151500-1]UYZ64861.1 SLOG family protein [Hymenobacter sp. YIM 151500-1]